MFATQLERSSSIWIIADARMSYYSSAPRGAVMGTETARIDIARPIDQADALSAWFENTARPRCLLDRHGRVIAVNASARLFLAKGIGFTLKHGSVDAVGPELRMQWRDALVRGEPAIVFAASMHRLKRFALLEPIEHSEIISVVFCTGARPDLMLLAPLARHYGLSAQHTRVLHELAHGRDVEQIARKLGVKVDTVRTHLKAIYAKLHIHSQTGLAAALLRVSKLPI